MRWIFVYIKEKELFMTGVYSCLNRCGEVAYG